MTVLRQPLTLAGVALGLAFLLLLGYMQRERFLTGTNDFVQLYAGSQLSGTPRLYDPEASKEVHRRELGVWLESVYYSRPPFYAWMLRPLGMLPYRVAYWTFEALNILALLAFLRIWVPRCRELPVIVGLFLPLLASLLAGQDVMFVLLAAALCIELMRRNRDFAAGIVLTLCAIKVHLFILVPLVLLVHRRWGVLRGGIAGGAVLAGISFLSDGLDWPRRYLALLSNPELHPGPEHMPTLRGLVYGFSGSEVPWMVALLSVVVVLTVVWIASQSHIELAIAFALVGGQLIGYHAYLQDCAILLLVFVLVQDRARTPMLRGAMALVVSPPLFLFLMAGQPWNVAVPLALLALLAMAPATVSTSSELISA